MRLDGLYVDLSELCVEELTVLSVHDSLDWSSEYLYIIFLEDACLIEVHTAVQGCLATECEEDSLRSFLLDYLLNEVCCHREEVYLVSHLLRCLDSSDIRVDEDGLDAFLLEGLEGL